jgi:hypothetical protein
MIAVFLVCFLGTIALGLGLQWLIWSVAILGDVNKGVQKWGLVTLAQVFVPPAVVLIGAGFITGDPIEIAEYFEGLGLIMLAIGPGIAAALIYRAMKGPELLSVFSMAICAPYLAASFVFSEDPKAALLVSIIVVVPLLLWLAIELLGYRERAR